MFQDDLFKNIRYLIHYPGDFNSKAEKEYPVIFYFHGSGSRGTNHDLIQRNDYFTIIGKYEDFPFITVAPQCHEDCGHEAWLNTYANPEVFAWLLEHKK